MGMIVFIMIVGFIVLIFNINSMGTARTNWKSAAHILHLSYVPGTIFGVGRITGVYEGYRVDVSTATKGSGNNSSTYTKFRFTYPTPIGFRFNLKKQTMLHNVGRFFGMQDIETGDSSFDSAALVQGIEQRKILRFLTAPLRLAIMSAFAGYREISITHEGIEATLDGRVADATMLVAHVRRLVRLADAITWKRETAKPIKKAKAARKFGDAQQVFGHVQEVTIEADHKRHEAMKMEGELQNIPDQNERAAEVFRELANELPDDPLAPEWTALASAAASGEGRGVDPPGRSGDSQSAPEPPPLSIPVAESPSESPPDLGVPAGPPPLSPPGPAEDALAFPEVEKSPVSFEEFSVKIFDPAGGSLRAKRLFESEFKESIVEWEGSLVSATDFSIDFVFKNAKGIKASFEIGGSPGGYGGKIKAIVQFPLDQREDLQRAMQKKTRFSGKLLSVDLLMKNVFLTEGRLL